jgi:hypothetical protein
MRPTPTSQENANGLQPHHGHRSRDADVIRDQGGSEPEITLPETCLVTHWVLTTKLILLHLPQPQPVPMTQMAHPMLNEHEALTKAQEQNANLMRTQPVAQITIPPGKVLTYTDQLQE